MPVLNIPTLTLYQPHATLVALGLKRIETRPRRTHHRGPLAIHAGLCTDWLDLCAEEPFKSVLTAAGMRGPADLPLGAVLCVTSVDDCVRMRSHHDDASAVCVPGYDHLLTPHERAFGNYQPGRWAYVLGPVRKLERPILATGHQGMWRWEVPEGVLAVQDQINAAAREIGRPEIDLINAEEEARIRELIAANTWPDKWDGTEPEGDVPLERIFRDGTAQPLLMELDSKQGVL